MSSQASLCHFYNEGLHFHRLLLQINFLDLVKAIAPFVGITFVSYCLESLLRYYSSLTGAVWRNYSMGKFFFFFCFIFLSLFFSCTNGIWKFLVQGSNLSQSSDLCHSCGNTGSLIHWDRPGIKLAPPQRQAGSLTHCTTAGTPLIGKFLFHFIFI